MRERVAVSGLLALVLVGALVAPVAGSSGLEHDVETAEPTLQVDLTAEGDARVSLVSVYDLEDADDRDAFESLREDENAQAEMLERFADRLDSVAGDIDGEMTVEGESVDVRTDDDRGVVVLSVTWHGLATVEGDTLVVSEPFASGYEPDRTLVVTAPGGATIDSTTPDPATEDDTAATWDAGSDLSGFEMTVSLTDSSADETTVTDGETDTTDGSDESPGFGAGIGALGIGAAVAFAIASRRRA